MQSKGYDVFRTSDRTLECCSSRLRPLASLEQPHLGPSGCASNPAPDHGPVVAIDATVYNKINDRNYIIQLKEM